MTRSFNALSLACLLALAVCAPHAVAQSGVPAEQEQKGGDGKGEDSKGEDSRGEEKKDGGKAGAKGDAKNDRKARAADPVPIDEIRRYVTVYNTIKQAYVEPVDDRELMQSAIRGLLLELDPHSAYMVRSAAEAFQEDTDGAYDGIGVEVQQQPDGTILVIAPIDDTPASRAGLKPGDVITAVDGKLLTPALANNNPLRGEPGSKTVLTVLREGAKNPLQITVVRDTIRISSVRGRMLEPGYGYVRISAFQADTADDFERQIDKLQAEAGLGADAGKRKGGSAGRGLRGLVIDLRSNPGGLLNSAVEIADDLLEKGRIVSTRGRNPAGDTEYNATSGDRMRGAPVAVLVDAGSASASEVLAAALRDNQRAKVVGSRTFGKGSVQTPLMLDNGDMVKLTTARYYTPSGASIQAHGIVPDIVLKPGGQSARNDVISEASLPGHLRGDQEGAAVAVGDVLEGDAPITAALAALKQQVAAAPAADKR